MTKSEFEYALATSSCLYHNGYIWYEHNDLIETLQVMGLFDIEKENEDDRDS